VLDTSDSNTHGFLSRDTFASSSYLNKPVWKKKECFSTLKTLICRMYSIQKLTQISHVNNVLCAPASDTDIFLCRDTCVSILPEEANFEQNAPLSTFKALICMKYTFQQLTQFSQGNNVLDAVASNIDGFPLRDTHVQSTQMSRPICNKLILSPP
jgi:hypothetical protein